MCFESSKMNTSKVDASNLDLCEKCAPYHQMIYEAGVCASFGGHHAHVTLNSEKYKNLKPKGECLDPGHFTSNQCMTYIIHNGLQREVVAYEFYERFYLRNPYTLFKEEGDIPRYLAVGVDELSEMYIKNHGGEYQPIPVKLTIKDDPPPTKLASVTTLRFRR